MKIKKIVFGIIAAIAAFVGQAESSTPFRLSLKSDGVRQSAGDETLTYSSQWDGGDGATVTIAENGAVVADGLSGEGTRSWSVTRNGTYVLTHTTYTNGIAGKVETATFVVTGKDVAFAADDVTVAGFAGKYDGAAHGIGVTVKDGIEDVVFKYAVSQTGEPPVLPESWSNEFPTITDVGAMTVWCEIASPGYITQTNSATVVISPREVTLTSGSASKVYDGTALANGNVTVGGDGFANGESVSCTCTGSQTNVGESENAFTYTLSNNMKASNYNITTANGTLTVMKANVGGGTSGGEEPGTGEVPQGGISKFDASFVYDGEGHTINTNALTAAFGSAMVGASVIEYAIDDGSVSGGVGHAALPWLETAPAYTNAGEYIVWYRVTNPNYNESTHAAKLSITKRDATLTSGSSSWRYDGVAHSNMAVTATGFVDGEGVTTNNFASIENIGSVANAFDYAFINGTLAANYNVTCVTGTLSVVSAQMDEWTDESKWTVTLLGNDAKYDGTEKTCEVAAIAYDGFSIPTYTVTGNKATDAGEYTLTVAGSGNFSGSHTFNWSIAKRAVTLTSGSASKVYDGTALIKNNVTVDGDCFVAGEGASYNVTGSQTNVGESENTFSYTLNDNTKASNYNITTANGTLTVTKANVGGGAGGGEEPGAGEVPQGGISKFDASFVYDGEGHTINTNAIVAAFGSAIVGASVIEYAVDDGSVSGGVGHAALPWCATAPVYTNAGEYIVWYRVTNPNYNEFIHAAKVTITPRTGVVVEIVGNVVTNVYSGAAQSVDGYTVAINDSLYKETDFEFTGNSAVSGTAAGKYLMGLNASQFTNKNMNFAGVTFNVTDGELVILEPPQKNVILDAIGGTFADGAVVTQECEDVYLAFPVATREGYVFDGWYLGVTNGAPKATVGAELLVDDDHTLFAKWILNTYTVAFDANGGSGTMAAQQFSHGVAQGLSRNAFVHKHYKFMGWATSPNGTVVYSDGQSINVTANATLYAVWEQDVRTLGGSSASANFSQARTFTAYALSEDSGEIGGLITIKTKKLITIKTKKEKGGVAAATVTIQPAGGKKQTIKGTISTADGTGQGALAGLTFTASGVIGALNGYSVDGAIDASKSKDAATVAVLNAFKGKSFVMALEPEAATGENAAMANGVAGFSIVFSAKGKAKVSGTMPAGMKVSVSSKLIVGSEWCCLPVVYSKTGNSLAFLLWFDREGNFDSVSGMTVWKGKGFEVKWNEDVAVSKVGNLSGTSYFHLADSPTEIGGAEVIPELLPVDVAITPAGTKWNIAKAKAVKLDRSGNLSYGANPSRLKLTYTAKTGMFKGSLSLYTMNRGRLKKNCVTISGIVVNGIGYGTATLKKVGCWPIVINGEAAKAADFKARITGVAVVDELSYDETFASVTFVPPETALEVPYGKMAVFRTEYDFPTGYSTYVWVRESGPAAENVGSSGLYFNGGTGVAYNFIMFREGGETCTLKSVRLEIMPQPEVAGTDGSWDIGTTAVNLTFK